MESNITLNDDIGYSKTGSEEPKYATYKWNFGDETPEVTGFAPGAPALNSPETSPCELPWKAPCDASTFHSYQYGGTYEVTFTVTDTGGNEATYTSPITVEGPPRPTPPPPPPPPAVVVPGPPGPASKPAVPNPVATAAIVSTSLVKTLRNGLVIRYSVNEQVAGRFEVLLDSSIAKRIGLHGPLATGLAKGTPPQIVIAKAILVTTKGGRNTVKILFGKRHRRAPAPAAQGNALDQADRPQRIVAEPRDHDGAEHRHPEPLTSDYSPGQWRAT